MNLEPISKPLGEGKRSRVPGSGHPSFGRPPRATVAVNPEQNGGLRRLFLFGTVRQRRRDHFIDRPLVVGVTAIMQRYDRSAPIQQKVRG